MIKLKRQSYRRK